ncbi:MAG: primosomal protein N' [Lachnospiraceae bacterium]|jgi:primosomal protein N' (replication factor Y)|nr:primosomal protein N' [Lachnospiraceae bacterium]
MAERYANIIVEISHGKIDRPFQYRIPKKLLEKAEVGSHVRIPFGKGNREIGGYIMEVTETADYPPGRIKEILDVDAKGIPVEMRMLKLAWWMKRHYGSTMIAALKTVLPVRQAVKRTQPKEVSLNVSETEAKELLLEAEKKHQVAKVRLLSELLKTEQIAYSIVTAKLGVSAQTLRGMKEKGILKIDVSQAEKELITLKKGRELVTELTKEQKAILSEFCADYEQENFRTYLLFGVTGSGKTEVYMNMIDKVLAQNRQAVMLIPEIALTYQTLSRFYARFGNRVALIHSRLSAGERYDCFERAKRGEVSVVIGPRTALFTPFPDLGLIVIDEEHESSYKSDTMPRFHTRETAQELARMCGASVVLGSATPSLTAYRRAETGEYRLFTMRERAKEAVLAQTQIIDLRAELKEGNRSIFSRSLKEKLADRLEKKEQSMLFINRRGYAGFVSCRACGHVMKCPHCDVSLTDHKNGRLVCHYCGYERRSVEKCPECGSGYISGFKVGTEQIEELLQKEFPKARILRMDADTTRKKDDFEKILQAFSNEEADVLVGTQMIVKGHDFPKVTLVGILAADLSLAAGDYQAPERTFQLLTQAAGRAGRGELPGEVVIQTYQPEHYAIVHAARQDYQAFYEEEFSYRDLMGYPPAAHMLAALFTGRDEMQVKAVAEAVSTRLKKWGQGEGVMILGASKAGISKINDHYRMVLYVKHADEDMLIQAKDRMEKFMKINEAKVRNVNLYFDFDPMNGY